MRKRIEGGTFRENRRKANDSPLVRVRSPQKPLYKNFVANFAFAQPNHVSFVEYDQANIRNGIRVLANCKV
ncbi:hypothetical protein DSM3645_03088 [Blastopirellula marina DSM 3645]|uniref:Uncharacterized protein n=1 Tax=Blastopirellula marina DSM 3645 TaxID=314230 RepID=A3ZVT1_9BACT|nr:hypothetical protein DSM3645_03088 [Blastopirellula marina DSM 3645]